VVKSIDNITSHVTEAIQRLPEKNKDTPGNWDSLIGALVNPAQDLEDIMQSMLDERSLTTSEGVNLDRMGVWVGENRLGRTDPDYLIAIYGKIAENNSETTEKDIMGSVRRFVTADRYEFTDTTGGMFKIILHNPTYPIDPRLYRSVDSAKAAGVGYSEFTTGVVGYFGFSDDSNAKGYSTIVTSYYSFYFSDTPSTPAQEIGIYESGGDYTLRMTMLDNSDAVDFLGEMVADFVFSTDGHIRLSDPEGIVWEIDSLTKTSITDNGVNNSYLDNSGVTADGGYTASLESVSSAVLGFTATKDLNLSRADVFFWNGDTEADATVIMKLWKSSGSTVTLQSYAISENVPVGSSTVSFVFDLPVAYANGEVILYTIQKLSGNDAPMYGLYTGLSQGIYGYATYDTGSYSTPPTATSGTVAEWFERVYSATGRVLDLALTSSGGSVEHCGVYKNGVLTTMAALLSDFSIYNTTTVPYFDEELIIRSYEVYDSQAGSYPTLLPRS
jgi:hypothetical protein